MTRRVWTAAACAALLIAGAAGAAAQDSAAAGKAVAFDRAKGNCLSCHTIKGGDVPSNVGPELADMKTRFPDRKALYAIIFDEESRYAQTVMPPFGKHRILTPAEIDQIIDFLYTL